MCLQKNLGDNGSLINLVCSAGWNEQTKMAANEEMPTKPAIMVEDYDKMKCDSSKTMSDNDVVRDSAPQGKGALRMHHYFQELSYDILDEVPCNLVPSPSIILRRRYKDISSQSQCDEGFEQVCVKVASSY